MNLYEADFSKIDSTGRLAMLFDAIPTQLNKNASRFQASSILNGESSDKVYSDKKRWRFLDVNCSCNGENCKINIAVGDF